jgi:hypothetical protein
MDDVRLDFDLIGDRFIDVANPESQILKLLHDSLFELFPGRQTVQRRLQRL